MREIVFPLISLGSPAEEMPDAADVAEWISKIKGNTADIITYNLQSSLSAQKPHAAETCAGDMGAFMELEIEFDGLVVPAEKEEEFKKIKQLVVNASFGEVSELLK